MYLSVESAHGSNNKIKENNPNTIHVVHITFLFLL